MSIDSIESILFRKNFLKQSIGSNFHTAEILGDRANKGVAIFFFAKQAERAAALPSTPVPHATRANQARCFCLTDISFFMILR
jgi:hypothetical protein